MEIQFDNSNIFSPRIDDAHHSQHVPSVYERIRIVGKGKTLFMMIIYKK